MNIFTHMNLFTDHKIWLLHVATFFRVRPDCENGSIVLVQKCMNCPWHFSYEESLIAVRKIFILRSKALVNDQVDQRGTIYDSCIFIWANLVSTWLVLWSCDWMGGWAVDTCVIHLLFALGPHLTQRIPRFTVFQLYSSMDFGRRWQLMHERITPNRFYW